MISEFILTFVSSSKMSLHSNGLVLSLSVIALILLENVQTHSWITCTDYIVKNDDVYDVSKCRAWPRAANSKLRKTKTFAQDTGFDTRPGENNPCQTARNDDQHYDREHPMAVYYPGQQVVLAHPMKNHGADAACTNLYIPDNGNFIYRGPKDGKSDPTLTQFRTKLVFDLGVSPTGQQNSASSTYPKPGFQNAPAFCDKTKATTDNALGTYSFNVPQGVQPGRYTFIWLWAFNGPADLYSTCFEVDIVANRQERDQKLLVNGFSDLSAPCGGSTSNPTITGNCNEPTIPTRTPSVTTSTKHSGEDRVECTCPCCGSLALKTNIFVILVAFLCQQFIRK